MYGATESSELTKSRASTQQSPLENGTESVNETVAEKPVAVTTFTYVLVACSALNSSSLGFDMGINTDVGPMVQHVMQLTDDQLGTFNGFVPGFAAVGCGLAHVVADACGRRATFLVSNVFVLLGLSLMVWSNSYAMLLFGRSVFGTGLGLGLVIDPLYIAEISPPHVRGWLITWTEIALTIGGLWGNFVGWILSTPSLSHLNNDQSWRAMLAVGCITPLVMLFLTVFVMPESPRWMVLAGFDETETHQVIRDIFGPEVDATHMKDAMKASLAAEENAYNSHSWSEVLCPKGPLKWMMIAGVMSAMAQQMLAIEPMNFYMQYIFRTAGGAQSRSSLAGYPIIVNIFKLAFTLMSGKLLDFYGRRPMMVLSVTGMGVSFFALSALFISHYTPMYLVVAAMAAWMSFYGLGAGPACWVLTNEIFSTSVRAKGSSVAGVLNRICACILVTGFLSCANTVGLGIVFGFFGVLSCMYAIGFWMLLPETNGVTLEEISASFCELDETLSRSEFRNAVKHRPSASLGKGVVSSA